MAVMLRMRRMLSDSQIDVRVSMQSVGSRLDERATSNAAPDVPELSCTSLKVCDGTGGSPQASGHAASWFALDVWLDDQSKQWVFPFHGV